MDSSALPYAFGCILEIIAILAFAIIGHMQRRRLMIYVVAWLTISATRNALIVLSAGESGALDRDTVRWLIRGLVYFQYLGFAASAIAFVAENVTLKRTNGRVAQINGDSPAEIKP